MIKQCRSLLAIAAIFASLPAMASGVSGLTTFSAGSPAKAADVNGNFTAVKTAVDDSQVQIDALKAQVATLQAQLNNVLAINQYLSLQQVNSQPTIRVSGANLQVVNGANDTATSNGKGNLIIGYDEARSSGSSQCSLGTNPNTGLPVSGQAGCTTAGGTWALSHKSGSHYLIVGSENNYSRFSGVVIGSRNTANYDYASVSGGTDNTASGYGASVSGGGGNTASGSSAAVSGGFANTASGASAVVNGGTANTASTSNASVSGGYNNVASGSSASVSGGSTNTASGSSTSVSGGIGNTASGSVASVSGGTSVTNAASNGWAAGGTGVGAYHSP